MLSSPLIVNMSQLSTFFPLNPGPLSNVTFGSIQNTPIGSTTPAAGTFTTLAANNGTLTASAPVLDLSQTWNNAAVTFTGMRFNVTNTASNAASKPFDFQIGGTSVLETNAVGLTTIRRLGAALTYANALEVRRDSSLVFSVRDDGAIAAGNGVSSNAAAASSIHPSIGVMMCAPLCVRWTDSSTSAFAGTADLQLFRDGAHVLAQRTGSNPQTFRLYNTFTDASNYERGFMRWSSNVLQIGTEAAGTGATRNIEIVGNTNFNNNVTVSAGRVLGAQQINLNTTSTALLALGTDSTIRWGAPSATAPLLKRSSTALQVRLADDSADAPLSCSIFNVNGNGAADLVAEFGTAAAGRSHAIQIWGNGTGRNHVITGATTAGVAFSYAAGGQHCAAGTNTTVTGFRQSSVSAYSWSNSSSNAFAGTPDLFLRRDAAGTLSQYDGVNGQAYRLYNTFTSTTSFERLNVRWASNECIIDAEAGSGGGTLRGIKIGSATSSLLGFYGATPVDRPNDVVMSWSNDGSMGDVNNAEDLEARVALYEIRARLRELGLMATT